MLATVQDHQWMQRALMLAEKAASIDEVPVGAVLVLNDEVIGEGHNQPISLNDPTAHAEIIALREGAFRVGNYRLPKSTLYVTLEPCMMCAGALLHARVQKLIFGATDPKAGVIVSKMQLLDQTFLNHRIQYQHGIQNQECGLLLSRFFQTKRLKSTHETK